MSVSFYATPEVLDPEPVAVKHNNSITLQLTLTIKCFQNTGYKSFLHKNFPDINDYLQLMCNSSIIQC